jgi:hypothetical protein
MKYPILILLMALLNVPFFPNTLSVLSFAFCMAMFGFSLFTYLRNR